MGFIGAYWRGEKPLWKSFFLTLIYGFLLIVTPGLLYVNIVADYIESTDVRIGWFGYCLFIYYSTLILWAVSVWRSSRISKQFWKIVARTIVIVILFHQAVGTYTLISFISEKGINCMIDLECVQSQFGQVDGIHKDAITEQNGSFE